MTDIPNENMKEPTLEELSHMKETERQAWINYALMKGSKIGNFAVLLFKGETMIISLDRLKEMKSKMPKYFERIDV